MKRRTFINILPVLAYTPLALAQFSVPLTEKSSTGSENSKNIDFQLSSNRLQDGSWIIWVRVILKHADFKTNIPLTLVIATDSTFSQVILRNQLTAFASDSYISTVQYKSLHNTLLYYKYEVNDAALLALEGQSNPVSSKVKTMTPWS